MEARDLVQSWLRGRADQTSSGALRLASREAPALAEKFRRAYRWIAEEAIHAPYRDIEFGTPLVLGWGEGKVKLRREAGYCSETDGIID